MFYAMGIFTSSWNYDQHTKGYDCGTSSFSEHASDAADIPIMMACKKGLFKYDSINFYEERIRDMSLSKCIFCSFLSSDMKKRVPFVLRALLLKRIEFVGHFSNFSEAGRKLSFMSSQRRSMLSIYNHFEISGTWRKTLLQKSEYKLFR